MTVLFVMSLVVGAAGIAVAAIVRVRDRAHSIPTDRVMADRRAGITDAMDAALLAGGVLRAVDARVSEFVDRGLVDVTDGGLSVAAEHERYLDMPVDDPAWTPPFDLDDAMLLSEIRRHGAAGMDAVRQRAVMWQARRRLARLMRLRLLVSPRRRVWEAMLVVTPTLLLMFGCTAAMMYRSSGAADEVLTAISVLAWIPAAGGIGALYLSRPGFHGRSPVSALGRAVLADVRGDRPDGREWEVALSAEGTEADVIGATYPSRWDVRARASRGRHAEPNAVSARRFSMIATEGPPGLGITGG